MLVKGHHGEMWLVKGVVDQGECGSLPSNDMYRWCQCGVVQIFILIQWYRLREYNVEDIFY